MLPAASHPVHRRAFGERVRTVRRELGLSQEELAHRARLDRTYVGGIERGERNPSLDNIHRLADALGVAPAALFADATPKESTSR